MPSLATAFRRQVLAALDLVDMSRRLRSDKNIGQTVRSHLTLYRHNLLSELAYLRVFNQWEVCLEEAFLRYLCGYEFMGKAETCLPTISKNIHAARAAVYGKRPYLLWHNPSHVVTRANLHFAAGSRLALVIGSALSDVENFAAIRHRIAHDHNDAKQKFDAATMSLASRRFPGGRPGAFLNHATTLRGNPATWLERICGELCSLASQLAP